MEAVTSRTSITLSRSEIAELTRYSHPSKQLAELHKQGFYRACLDRNGQVKLERAHYQAVCMGVVEMARPKVKPPRKAA